MPFGTTVRASRRALQQPGVWVPDHSLDGWRNALSSKSLPRLAQRADSIGQGQYPNAGSAPPLGWSYRGSGWYHKLIPALEAKYGIADAAEWFDPTGDGKWGSLTPNYQTPDYHGGGGVGVDPWVQIDTTRGITNEGWWWLASWATVNTWTSAANALAQFNTPDGTVRLQIAYGGRVASTWRANIGGTPGSVGDQTITVTQTDGTPRLVTVWNGIPTNAPLYVGNQSVASAMLIYGVLAWKNTTKGLVHGRMAHGGRTAGQYGFKGSGTNLMPADKIPSLFNANDTYGDNFPRNPDLYIQGLGSNDCNNLAMATTLSFGPDGYQRMLHTEYWHLQNNNPGASMAVYLPWHGDMGMDQDNVINDSSYRLYREAALDACLSLGMVFFDFSVVFGSRAATLGYVAGDAHPTELGQQLMSDTMLARL